MVALVREHDTVIEASPIFRLRADRLGRWVSFGEGRGVFRRTLDGRVVVRRGSAAIDLDEVQADRVHERVAERARELHEALATLPADTLVRRGAEQRSLAERLLGIAALGAEHFQREAARFREVYPEEVTILPPDRYHDIVVEPATGCPNAHCTFCAFYRGRLFRPLSASALADHLRAVVELLGPLGEMRRGIFLGSGSALSLGQRRMIALLEAIDETFGRRRRGVASFLDPDHAPERDVEQWRALVERGLTRVVVGLETGIAELRAELGKSADLDRVIRSVRAQQDAGAWPGITILVGAGGAARSEEHRLATVRCIAAMQLDASALIYLSPLEHSMDADRIAAERDAFERELRAVTDARVVPYVMERFRYYVG